jgi:hypothetical protein
LPRELSCGQAQEQRLQIKRWRRGAEFNAAEKGGNGMALKIFTGANHSQNLIGSLFGIKEIKMLPNWEELESIFGSCI